MMDTALLQALKDRAAQRKWPRNCPHRGKRVGWKPDGQLSWKVWECTKYGIQVTWHDCHERSEAENCNAE